MIYEITVDGTVIEATTSPWWIRMSDSGAWVNTDEKSAEMIAVKSVRYNIAGKPVADADMKTATVRKLTAEEMLYQTRETTSGLETGQKKNEDSVNTILSGIADLYETILTAEDTTTDTDDTTTDTTTGGETA